MILWKEKLWQDWARKVKQKLERGVHVDSIWKEKGNVNTDVKYGIKKQIEYYKLFFGNKCDHLEEREQNPGKI